MEIPLRIALRKWCELLEVHGGRDKVTRLSGYVCTFVSDLPVIRDGPLSPKIKIIGRQISLCRTVLRLFDDLPHLNRVLSYGFGSSEKDWIIRITLLASNLINTIYYPVEHLAWAGDQGVISVNSSPLWKVVSYCWASTMYLAIIRTVRTISMLIQHKRHLMKSDNNMGNVDIVKFHRGMVQELLTLVQQLSDFGLAINSIPGLLWGGKLKPRHTGFLGMISSLVALAKLLKLVP